MKVWKLLIAPASPDHAHLLCVPGSTQQLPAGSTAPQSCVSSPRITSS